MFEKHYKIYISDRALCKEILSKENYYTLADNFLIHIRLQEVVTANPKGNT